MKNILNPYITLLEQEVKVCYGWYKSGDGFKNDKKNPLSKNKVNIFDEKEYDIGKNNKIFKTLDKIIKSINGNKKQIDGRHGDTALYLHMVTVVGGKNDVYKKGKHYVATVYGGLNGPGKWENYCRDFATFFAKVRNNPLFEYAYFGRLNNDCADDVFTAYICFKLKEKE